MIGKLSIGEQYKELLLARQALTPSFSQKVFVWALLALKVQNWVLEAEFSYGGVPQIIKYILAGFFVVAMLYSLYQRPLAISYYGLLAPVVFAFCCLSLWLVAQSFKPNVRYFQFFFAAKYYAMPFLLPVFILFTRFDLKFVKYLIEFSIKFIPILILLELFVLARLNIEYWQEQLHLAHIFNFALPLVLLNIHYMPKMKKQRTMLLVYYFILVILGSIYGRRGYVIDLVLLLGAYYMLMAFNRVVSFNRKLRTAAMVTVVVLAMVMMLGTLKSSLYIFERGFDSAAFEETRGSVFKEFFADFGTVSSDWLWGRGLDGRVLRTMDQENGGYGNIIENGYLYVLLKAGGIYLLLMVLIFLRSIYLGFFKSRNQMSKSFAAILLLYLIGMIAFNLPVFSPDYVVAWICVVLCHVKDIRKLEDRQVRLLLNI